MTGRKHFSTNLIKIRYIWFYRLKKQKMRKIALLGKKSYEGKRFKSVGPNQLSVSDKTSIRNNINQLTKQQLAYKIGKPIIIIEKFIKKENLTSSIETQKVVDLLQPVAPAKSLPITPNITVLAT
jgi:hypothetical protein